MKKPTIRQYVTSSVFAGVIGLFFVLNLLTPSPDVLIAERRVPARFPQINADEILSGSFTNKIDNWAIDNFVFRDMLRSINSFYIFNILRQEDKSGLYRSGAGLGKIKRIDYNDYELTARKILNAANIFNEYDMNYYYSVIPDKAEFEQKYRPGFTEREAIDAISDILIDFTCIPLADSLNSDSYYMTDLHWNQSMISDVARVLLTAMGADNYIGKHMYTCAGEFFGIYAGEYALPVVPDVMLYADITDLRVSYLSNVKMNMDIGPIYDIKRFEGIDPYDFFLQGPQPLVVIENDNADGGVLYMFRDSYGSSLAPLFAEFYSKIVLIDLRYIYINAISSYIEYEPDSDVLFIYSSQIFGNPIALQS